ncbi:P-loop containing nucleoside triphosphate hydrolase protein [Metschnikowia bicuspidata var. bicuspidata NRRL YB-4993]|uniref:p-loop containing nucleoside triphosphate hydrolase protein n=1 Tax=Metschnikowia bicuspidata var. bicuspidata NRRL YB-4993 TaxID=869754 RepID=A0A1A0HFG2_9ASCO|nr:P-loop containing nucleoside triphosphate hydrolase protein [Metschnikowia bicuspidata var. bicuspidata NRRL YB-4993]OBA22637.1 P-loop containing nucleoside triphosphate hydrolase protein [Metschnikowia bicuspidata var. bicuspidata NRRL YB-4993]
MPGVLSWKDVSVSSGAKNLLENVSGHAEPGTVTALMGPSGSGKTTLLSVLSQRTTSFKNFDITGDLHLGDEVVTSALLRGVSRFVEQEDHLLGCLTVKELIEFSIMMLDKMPRDERKALVEKTVDFFGLTKQKSTIVGTPVQKGLSGGQKRRLSVACQVVTKPSVLFLDEPTSGLDSTASFEVMNTLKKFAKEENVIIIASIHQPSTLTFDLFDNVMFLTEGKIAYAGPRESLNQYFEDAGYPIPPHYNPAEYVLDLINTDFSLGDTSQREDMNALVELAKKKALAEEDVSKSPFESEKPQSSDSEKDFPGGVSKTWALLQRGMIKARRDYLAYYVRLVMYFGLAILMGTVWLRLSYSQENIQLFTNAIFFSGAFMSFMSVAYIPAYLEDYFSYRKERSNGLYGPFSFMVANFIIGVPFLFLIVVMFSIITYFMCNFTLSARGFFMYVLYLFINLLAAESLTILIATIFPVFVVALALTAFANGLWMAVGGFLVSASVLNVFWYYTFYWIDYQRYAFQGMMFNQFKDTIFRCASGCQCMYSSSLEDQCLIKGAAVLEALGYGSADHGLWVGLMLVLTFVLRLATYIVLKLRK